MATNEPNPALRLTFLSVVVLGLFLALFSRLWFLQVLAGDRYQELADSNRERHVLVEAPRGRILGSDGDELVKNRPALTISGDRQRLLDASGEPVDEDTERVLERLSDLLQLEVDDIIERLSSRRFSVFRPIPIAVDVAPEIVFALREQQELFPGIVAETLPVRTYPLATAAAHLVGYLGEISEEELADHEQFGTYQAGELIGRGGLEQVYEADLRGQHGRRVLEVNARNTVIDVLSEREPVPGNDLLTTLDLDLQAAAERLLEEGLAESREWIHRASGRTLPSTAGSVVALDPRDGSVLAMASYPSFDPREFVGGVSHRYWEQITSADNHFPLINRAIQSTHPPGSVFKVVTGAAYVEAGLITPSGQLPCPPSYSLGRITFRNWNRAHEGSLNLSTALMRSCDTYFYKLAHDLWAREQRQGDDVEEAVPEVAHRFGIGRTLGVDLPSERAGIMPGREWRRSYWEAHHDTYCRLAEELPPGYGRDVNADLCQSGMVWRGGDAINSSIGQGDVLTTPLQIASAYAAIANGGTLYRPHIGQAILDPDGEVVRQIEAEALGDLGLGEATLRAMQDGLRRVVMEPRGTAHGPFVRGSRPFPLDQIPVAGKTGTAELKPKVPFAWFVAYAPADDPEIVVVVNVEEGGGGSQTAAPIVRSILEHYFGVTDVEDIEVEEGDPFQD